FVQWTPGRVKDHGALFDLIVGRWGEGASAADRVAVTLDYRLLDSAPAFMVIDATGRPTAESDLVGKAMLHAEVIGTPLAQQVFDLEDAIVEQDGRMPNLIVGDDLL